MQCEIQCFFLIVVPNDSHVYDFSLLSVTVIFV
jgi:hypothetical protein